MKPKRIREKFKQWRERKAEEPTYPELYEAALSLVEDENPTSEGVKNFCQEAGLKSLDGLFVSALINSMDDEVELPDMGNVDFVGYRNQGKIKVNGSVGRHLGESMSRGRIVVEGDAGERTGEEMSGGEILIKGDSGFRTGLGMTGGKIVVEGELGEEAGWCKKCGEIIDR